jgi:hypothetical protein
VLLPVKVTVQSPAATALVPSFTVGWLTAFRLIAGAFGGVRTSIPSVALEGENVMLVRLAATSIVPFAVVVVSLIPVT